MTLLPIPKGVVLSGMFCIIKERREFGGKFKFICSIPQTMRDKLAEALCSKEKLQQELKLQMSMKAEMEVAMKLLEKDVHEKQDTVVSLRGQLEEIKDINLDLYTKLQVSLIN